QARDQARVARPTTRDDELGPANAGRSLARQRVRDGASGQRLRRRERVILRAAVPRDAFRELRRERPAEFFAAGALGSALREIRVPQCPAEHGGVFASATPPPSAVVEAAAPTLRAPV